MTSSNAKRLPLDKARLRSFPIESIIDHSVTDFDLYLETEGILTLYAPCGYTWSKSELSRLLANGHKCFYYWDVDHSRAQIYRKIHSQIVIKYSDKPRETILNLTNAASEMTRILYEHEVTPAVLSMTRTIAEAMVETIKADPTCVSALKDLVKHDDYTYYHSARVSAYAVAIAWRLSEREPQRLSDIATGSLLHDVGKSKVPLAVLNKQGAFTPQEWEAMRQHPVHGEKMVMNSLFEFTPREIILHHHERLDGTGYPHQLSAKEILAEVKIVAFADVYDALTTSRPYQVRRDHFEALRFIRDKLLPNVDREAYRALVELLAGRTEASL